MLELLQNFDDNTYAPSIVPTVHISLTNTCLTFDCNELGFELKDIDALCNVGSSTKTKGSGYIGHKGIGFKAVFKVSDTPEVHSKHYHISFDKNDRIGLGYIVPRPANIPPKWDWNRKSK